MAPRATRCLRGHEIARVGRDAKGTCRQCKAEWYERHYTDLAWRFERQAHQVWYWHWRGRLLRHDRATPHVRATVDRLVALYGGPIPAYLANTVADIYALLDKRAAEPEGRIDAEYHQLHRQSCYAQGHRVRATA